MTTATLDILSQPALAYDYSQILDADDRHTVQQCAADIKPRLRRAAEDIVVIGQRLIEVKDHLPHGQWRPWLETEFEMSKETAINFMRVGEKFAAKNGIITHLTPTALYLLASPSTPDAAIQEVEERIAQGAAPTVAETKKIIKEAKAPAPARKESPWPTWGEEDLIPPSPPSPARATLPADGKKLVDWEEEDWDTYSSIVQPDAPTDNALLSVEEEIKKEENVDGDWVYEDTDDDHLYLDDDDPQDAAEVQRRWLVSVLARTVADLCNPKLQTVAESYAYGLEYERLCRDARTLHAAIRDLTTADQI